MKPFIEQISFEKNFSWRVKSFQRQQRVFEWHYHLEYELVLLRNCSGQLFVGNSNMPYGHNTLAMFGPRLPHTSYIDQPYQPDQIGTLVVWFSHAWVTELLSSLPQLKPISRLLHDSNYGVLFDDQIAEKVYQCFEGFEELSTMQQSWRVVEVLIMLTEAEHRRINTAGIQHQASDDEAQLKIARAIQFIELNYRRPICIAELAEHLHISISSVQRLFDKHFLESFSEHVTQYRLGKACELLINTDRPVSLISEQAGFSNLSNFNRHFKQHKRQTPREFRDRYRHSTGIVAR